MIMTSLEDVLAFLRPRLNSATGPDEIAKMMAPLASDFGWAYLGGSGSRQQIFQLEGNLRAVFQFSGTDMLVAYGIYRNTDPWKKTPSGQMSPVSNSEVSLILVEGENEQPERPHSMHQQR
jgi:hypothetical protein